ncbi:hypothetical protein JIN85_07740 [Luteolibacter pohnpeiensis]|uniref:Uncharacterized protein n=1 Tax=Luteolibacter pohnpeiensis TaxID=454153 RepID=A0A934S7N0_9BACT|nr:hypothetical protein [Luteolibacter pohnpeiensis]MBK1882301.1 hypothetical protein [Luteolibacter pohnpeiensis]
MSRTLKLVVGLCVLGAALFFFWPQHDRSVSNRTSEVSAEPQGRLQKSVNSNELAEQSTEIPQSNRHAAGGLKAEKQRRSIRLKEQLEKLHHLEGDELLSFAEGLKSSDHSLFSNYLAAKRKVAELEADGLGVVHPSVKSAMENRDELKAELETEVADLSNDLQDQIHHLDSEIGGNP